jgi:hypothetical protein
MGIKKKIAIRLAILAVIALVALALFWGWASRELILERDGIPLANLKGNIMPAGVAGSPIVPTSTDPDGRLDLSGVPSGAEQILVSLWDNAGNILLNTNFDLPTSGSRTVNFQGNRTTSTTTYVDFGFYKYTEQVVWEKHE